MSTKAKGDYLEMIIGMLETALADNPSTVIKMNYLIKDEDDFDREIDIYVETTVNRKKFRYAFECKCYGGNSKVEMGDIDKFCNKIRKTDIKGLFVSTGHFQANAIKKAKKNCIEVWTIKEAPDVSFFEEAYFHKKRHAISLFTPGRKKQNNLPNNTFELKSIYIDGKSRKKKIDTGKLYSNFIKPSVKKLVLNNMKLLYKVFYTQDDNSFSISMGRKEKVNFTGNTKELLGIQIYSKEEGSYHELDIYKCEIEIWIELEEITNLIVKTYQSIDEENPIAQFISSKTILNDDDERYLSIVKIEGSHGYKFLMSDTKNKENIIEANQSITFEADQIKITPKKDT